MMSQRAAAGSHHAGKMWMSYAPFTCMPPYFLAVLRRDFFRHFFVTSLWPQEHPIARNQVEYAGLHSTRLRAKDAQLAITHLPTNSFSIAVSEPGQLLHKDKHRIRRHSPCSRCDLYPRKVQSSERARTGNHELSFIVVDV